MDEAKLHSPVLSTSEALVERSGIVVEKNWAFLVQLINLLSILLGCNVLPGSRKL